MEYNDNISIIIFHIKNNKKFMKISEFYKKHLPEDIAEKAIKNLKEDIDYNEFISEADLLGEICNISFCLNACFDFKKTPIDQGFNYWHNICKQYGNLK